MAKQIINERELIGKILKGNIKAFEDLIIHYQKLVSLITFRMLKNEFDREEVCHEVFIKIYQNLTGFHYKSKLSTWIGKITYNHCLNYIQKQHRHINEDIDGFSIENKDNYQYNENLISEENNPEEQVEEQNKYQLIQKQINQLPEIYKVIITLYHIEEFSYNEISEIMDLPSGTVKSYLFRARKVLKEKLLSSHKEEEFI